MNNYRLCSFKTKFWRERQIQPNILVTIENVYKLNVGPSNNISILVCIVLGWANNIQLLKKMLTTIKKEIYVLGP